MKQSELMPLRGSRLDLYCFQKGSKQNINERSKEAGTVPYAVNKTYGKEGLNDSSKTVLCVWHEMENGGGR